MIAGWGSAGLLAAQLCLPLGLLAIGHTCHRDHRPEEPRRSGRRGPHAAALERPLTTTTNPNTTTTTTPTIPTTTTTATITPTTTTTIAQIYWRYVHKLRNVPSPSEIYRIPAKRPDSVEICRIAGRGAPGTSENYYAALRRLGRPGDDTLRGGDGDARRGRHGFISGGAPQDLF